MSKTRRNETINLVTLINHLLNNTGLLSYTGNVRVHWAANFCAFCFLTACVLQVIALFKATDNSDQLFECFSVLSFCGMGVLKLHSLRKNHEIWRKLLNQIPVLEDSQMNGTSTSYGEYDSDSEQSVNFSDYINIYTKKFRRTSAIFNKLYTFTAFIFIISPFVDHVLCNVRGMVCSNHPHILPGWAPLDDISIFGYLVTVLCEFLAATYCVAVHIAFDFTAVGIMVFICGQFSILREYSSFIGGKGKQCNISKRRDNRAHFRIVRCHQTNIVLVNSITELDKLLQNIIGVYFSVATLTLCSVAVRLKMADTSVTQLISLIQYMCATLIQLFLFCWYGDAVSNESSMGMGEGPFAAASWCLSPRMRRNLTILGASMMTPRHLRAGPFNYIDLPSFIQVIRAAYSYYAVLATKE